MKTKILNRRLHRTGDRWPVRSFYFNVNASATLHQQQIKLSSRLRAPVIGLWMIQGVQ